MIELGTSLAEARLARGLTLEDAERSTRIARKFLVALEEHNYAVFPAPVYARGFLRTYCRYLGLDPEEQLAELPAGWNGNAPATPLPPVSQPMNFNFTWIIAGLLIAGLAGAIYLFTQDDDGINGLQANLQDGQTQQGALPSEVEVESNEPSSETSARTLEPGLPGVLPDFNGVNVDEATSFLEDQSLEYLVIETPDSSTQAGTIMEQTPDAGSATDGLERITLTSSTGTTQPANARTDCALLESSNSRSSVEHAWYQDNCQGAESPTVLPDRTSCEQIRGTEYRSPTERQFFLTNCVVG